MKLEKLTKPQIILLWMTTCSKYTDALCEGDKEVLIKNKAFKDRKSISNALYQLHNAGYIKKFKDSWFILDAGKQHLANAIAVLQKEADKLEPESPKAEEWTDADFGITPEVRTYIDKLEAENAKLKELLDHAHVLHESNLATYDAIAEENARLKQELDAVNLQMKMRENEILDLRHDISLYAKECTTLRVDFRKCNIAYDELAEKNTDLKAQLEKLNAQIQKQHALKSDVAKFIDACNDFIKSFRIEN